MTDRFSGSGGDGVETGGSPEYGSHVPEQRLTIDQIINKKLPPGVRMVRVPNAPETVDNSTLVRENEVLDSDAQRVMAIIFDSIMERQVPVVTVGNKVYRREG